MASLKIAHFWGNLLAWGYETIFQYYGSIDPLLMGGVTHNEAPKHKSVAPVALNNAYLWLRWPFSPYGGTHNEAPKRKNVAPLAL